MKTKIIDETEASDLQMTLQYCLETFEQSCQCGECDPCTRGQEDIRRGIAKLDEIINQGKTEPVDPECDHYLACQRIVQSSGRAITEPVVIPKIDMTRMTCQEAHHTSVGFYIQCGKPAIKLVLSERGRRLYPMCGPCADHNISNRGAVLAATHEKMNV